MRLYGSIHSCLSSVDRRALKHLAGIGREGFVFGAKCRLCGGNIELREGEAQCLLCGRSGSRVRKVVR